MTYLVSYENFNVESVRSLWSVFGETVKINDVSELPPRDDFKM